MPLSANRRKVQTKTVLLEQDGETAKIVYRPSEWSTRVNDELLELDGAELNKFTVDFVCRLVVEWDILTEDDGPPVPITPDGIRQYIDQPMLNEIVGVILEDIRPKARKGKR